MGMDWDCIVVGAGAAGLSAALVLGRARRRTLVVDLGGQSNRPAEGIGGLLGQDGRPPEAFYAAARAEIARYPTVELRSGTVVAGEPGFALELDDGSREQAPRVLLATGMEYRYPALPGIAERWGRSVFHCPFCHGWEVRDGRLAVLGGDVRRAVLLRAWSDDVTLLTNGPAEPEARDAPVTVDEREVAGLRGPGDTLTAIEFADGSELPCDGLLVPVTLHQRSALATQLGAATADPGPMVADGVEVDGSFQTSVEGLYAAGDLTGRMQSVANSIAAGSSAAAMIVHSLVVPVESGVSTG